MDLAMKMSAFEQLGEREMMHVEGGLDPATLIALGILIFGIICTTKGCADADHGI